MGSGLTGSLFHGGDPSSNRSPGKVFSLRIVRGYLVLVFRRINFRLRARRVSIPAGCSAARVALVVCACLGAMESAPARAGDPPATLPERKTIVVLGDSLAAGYGLDSDEAFPGLLQKKI